MAAICFPLALVVLLALALASGFLIGGQQRLAVPPQQVSDADLKKLIFELGDTQFKVREKAMKRLSDIGLLALDAIEHAEANAVDLETKQRAANLAKEIRKANGLPTKVDGMIFKLVLAKKCGQGGRVNFELHFTNTTKTPLRINLKGTLTAFLTNRKGRDNPAICRFGLDVQQ